MSQLFQDASKFLYMQLGEGTTERSSSMNSQNSRSNFDDRSDIDIGTIKSNTRSNNRKNSKLSNNNPKKDLDAQDN